jgi:uncharacterized protein YdeI (YjbR/CyaY-like superfamily)
MSPVFFATPADLRAWLEKHHETDSELWIGFYKKASGKPSIIWQEAVDELLCVGWIDGIRKTIDDESYMIRATPRKPTSTWSAVNINRVAVLQAEGRMQPAGLKAFSRRKDDKSAIYAYEQRQNPTLDPAEEAQFTANAAAWAYFLAQPPGYQRTALHWVISAKKDETRRKRLATLIECCEGERPIPSQKWGKK